MKKITTIYFGSLMLGLTLIGCTKESDVIEYADLSVEQNKEKIQEDGLATMEKLEGLSELSAVSAVADFISLVDSATMPEIEGSEAVSALVAPVAALNTNYRALMGLRSVQLTIDSISEIMDQVGGIYTYQPATNEFTRVANTSEITFIYPIGSSTTNNGELKINNVTTQNSTNPDVEGELPKTLSLQLKKNNATIFSFDFNASYNSHSVPTSLSTSFAFLEGYTFSQTYTDNDSQIDLGFAFKLDGSNLMSASFTSKGDFSYETLQNPDELDLLNYADQVIDNANATVQVGNLKMTGMVNFNQVKNILDEYNDEDFQYTDSTAVKTLCAGINTNVAVVLLYAEENEAIAMSNFYAGEYEYITYNEVTGQPSYEIGYMPSMRMVFKNGSALDGSFFNTGFEDLITSFEDLITLIQNSYGQSPQ
jgi:hypothetical protein